MNTSSHKPQELMRLAQGFIGQQEYKNGLAMLYQSIGQYPDFIPAYLYLSRYFLHQGQTATAMQVLSKALEQVPGQPNVCQMLAPLLAPMTPQEYHPILERDIQYCYDEAHIDHQQLARVAAQLLLYKYQLLPGENKANWNQLVNYFQTDKLWINFLSRGANTHPVMEARLTELRAYLLKAYSDSLNLPNSLVSFISALALQLFSNEYVLFQSDNEKEQCTQLQHLLSVTTDNNKQISISLLLSLYQPLTKITDLPISLLQQSTKDFPLLHSLLEHSFFNIHTEENLAKSIPCIATIADTVSNQVRDQYEESPYPRWQAPPTPAARELATVIRALPRFDSAYFTSSSIQLLVAGCGTGYEPIDLARMDKSLTISAIDLSRSSLAYAQRMAQQLDVAERIKFQQGDILALDKTDQQFDVIISTGVLHHMSNPEEGWRKLCAVIKPGGVMRISLYSERARARIVAGHTLIKQLKLQSTHEDIKRFRQKVLNMNPQSTLGELANSDDFYTTSSCRDLLFHVQEHRYTLPRIAETLAYLGLRLVGFEAPSKAISTFKQQFGEKADLLDLQLWDQFENDFPDTFVGMYQFWCQKTAM